MDENRFLSGEEMSIKLKDLKACNNLYCYKPCPVPAGMRSEAKALIDNLEAAGIIRKVSETSETCAPASFVKKKSGGLRFVIDFTQLNRAVVRPVHSFPSTDQVANMVKPNIKFFATLDFLNRVFSVALG